MDVLMDNSLALMLIGIFAIASLFHGVTGIGVTLIASTALASVYPMPTVLVLTVFPCLIINWLVFVSGGNAFDYVRRYWLLVLTSFVGSLIGTKLVFVIAQSYLLIALGLLIVAYVVMQIIAGKYHKSIRLPNTTGSLIVSGTLAGVLGGATNAMSPLLVMYLLSATEHLPNGKTELIRASNLCYVVGKVAQLIVLWQPISALPPLDMGAIAIASMVAVICLYVGFYFQNKLPQALFKKLVLAILFVLGVKALVTGLS